MLTYWHEYDKALLYGLTGEIPEYLERLDPAGSADENIISLFFDRSGRLFEEPANLLKQELRHFAIYNSVLNAIASGSSRLNEIATRVGEDTAACTNQLRTLISLAIIKKETPALETDSGRKTIYSLEDSMFAFWSLIRICYN